jgi:hypothetical protein
MISSNPFSVDYPQSTAGSNLSRLFTANCRLPTAHRALPTARFFLDFPSTNHIPININGRAN